MFRGHKQWHGQLICLYVLMHSVARLILEHFRGDFRGSVFFGMFTTTQVVSALLLTAAGIVWIVRREKAGKTWKQS